MKKRFYTYTIAAVALLLFSFSVSGKKRGGSYAHTPDITFSEGSSGGLKILITPSKYTDTAAMITDYYMKGIKAIEVDDDSLSAFTYFRFIYDNLDSTHAATLYQLSNLYNDDSVALNRAARAVAGDSTNEWYRYRVAELSLGRNIKQGIEAIRPLIASGRGSEQAYRYLAALYQADGRTLAASETIDSAMARFGPTMYTLAFKHDILLRAHEYDKAESNARAMVEMDSTASDGYRMFADVYMTRGIDTMAEKVLLKALSFDSENDDVIRGLCSIYEKQPNKSKYLYYLNLLFATDAFDTPSKITYFDNYIKTPFLYSNYFPLVDNLAWTIYNSDENSAEAMDFYADHNINSGKLDKALEIFKKQWRNGVNIEKSASHILRLDDYLGHHDSIVPFFREAMLAMPHNTELPLIASYIELQRDTASAIAMIEATLSIDKKIMSDSVKSVYYCSLGDVVQLLNLKSAEKSYKAAIKYNPQNIVALNNYAYLLTKLDKSLDKALVMMDSVLAVEPSNPTYIDTRAWVLYKIGRLQEAKDMMLKAVSLDTDSSSEILSHYSEILAAMGDETMAQIYKNKSEKAKAAEIRRVETSKKRALTPNQN